MTHPEAREPIFNAPAVVVALLAVLALAHGLRLILPDETDFRTVLALALIPGRTAIAADLPGGETAIWTQFLTHMLLHGDVVHLLINLAWLLAFGTILARRLNPVRFLLFFLFCGVAGGLAFYLAHQGELQPMVGASGAVSGLMGGVMLLFFPAADLGSTGILNRYARQIPRMRLSRAIRDRRMLAASAVLVALNLLLATSFGGFLSGGGIAWEAHLGGYFAGLIAFSWFDDGPVEPNARSTDARPAGDEPV